MFFYIKIMSILDGESLIFDSASATQTFINEIGAVKNIFWS